MMGDGDRVLLGQAVARLQAGAPGEAERLLARLSLAARAHPDTLYLLALAAEGQGQHERALDRYAAAVRAAPHNAAVMNSQALLLDRLGRVGDAIAVWQRATAAAPRALDPWINLALAAARAGQDSLASEAAARARALAPGDPRVRAVAGHIALGQGDAEIAIADLEAALAVNPRDLVSRHNLGSARRLLGHHEAALADLEAAIAAGLRAPQTLVMRGHVLADLRRFDAAVDQYRQVLAALPDQPDAHAALVELLPQIGRRDEALDGWRAALARMQTPDMWSAAIAAARSLGDGDQALRWADAAIAAHGPRPEWQAARIGALVLAGDHAAAERAANALHAARPDSAAAHAWLAWLRLRAGDAAAAEHHALSATRIAPDDQSPWSLLSIIWRLNGDPRERWLIDYDRLVIAADLVTPPGWRDREGFLADLEAELTALHVTLQAPADQSLRGGTQTRGALFDSARPVIRAFRDAVGATIAQALAPLRPEAGHPFLGRLTGRTRFVGSWSVRLASQGFHVSHIHQTGWLSSAFHLGVPPEVGGDRGVLQFGVPETALGLDLPPRRLIVPQRGRLVVFPSYVWHGTTPFDSSAVRLTAAFDALPA